MESEGHDSFCFPSSGLSRVQGLNPHTRKKSEAQQWSQFRKPPLSPNALRPSPPPCDEGTWAAVAVLPEGTWQAQSHAARIQRGRRHGPWPWQRQVSQIQSKKYQKSWLECESQQRSHVLLGFQETWLHLPPVLLFLLNVGRRCALGDQPALTSSPSQQHFPWWKICEGSLPFAWHSSRSPAS